MQQNYSVFMLYFYCFRTLDLISGYWLASFDKDAQEKSAFATRSGLWKQKVLPFGLTSTPATSQRLIERVVCSMDCIGKVRCCTLDNIIVIALDVQQHTERLVKVFQRLQQARLKLKPIKRELLQKEVKYLGPSGVATDPTKKHCRHKRLAYCKRGEGATSSPGNCGVLQTVPERFHY